ncbi:MAG: hypothetical protein ACI936_002292 [Paraglaciecola sp.]|jgi:hypothetical protein
MGAMVDIYMQDRRWTTPQQINRIFLSTGRMVEKELA